MMPEIALNVLDIAQNSVRAEASLIQISVDVDEAADTLTITIEDNGCGMTSRTDSPCDGPVLYNPHNPQDRSGGSVFQDGCRKYGRQFFYSV